MFVSSFCSELLPQRRGLPCLLGIEAQSHVGIVVLHGVKTHFRVVWRGINENQGYETKSGHVIRHKTCHLLNKVATFVKTSNNGLSVQFDLSMFTINQIGITYCILWNVLQFAGQWRFVVYGLMRVRGSKVGKWRNIWTCLCYFKQFVADPPATAEYHVQGAWLHAARVVLQRVYRTWDSCLNYKSQRPFKMTYFRVNVWRD